MSWPMRSMRSLQAGCRPRQRIRSRARSIPKTGFHFSGSCSVLSRVDEITEDIDLAELLAGFEPLQPLHQNETIAVAPHQDRRLLAELHDALGKLVDRRGLEFGAAFDRDVDVGDGNRLAL